MNTGMLSRVSGMDFVLGGDAEQAGSNVVAIEITKLVVDRWGKRIRPSTATPVNNSSVIYQDADGDPASVIGLGIDAPTPSGIYYGYTDLHSKNIKVGADGIGLVYDYDVTPGMYYIHEDPASVRDDITDTSGTEWHYVGTRIETESPWRDDPGHDDHMHVSDVYDKENGSYNSVPEVLGNYPDINGNTTWNDNGTVKPIRNGFLEFYVYNIYERTYPVYLKKADAEFPDAEDRLAGAESDLYGPYEHDETTAEGFDPVQSEKKQNESPIITTAANVKLGDLSDGIYYLVETRAPENFRLLDGPVVITVDSSKEDSQVVSYRMPNEDVTVADYITQDELHEEDVPYHEILVLNQPLAEADIVVKKVKMDENGNLTENVLKDATFRLEKYTDDTFATKDGSWAEVTFTTGADGTYTLSQLGEGYYKLVETVCPPGYLKTGVDPTFRVYREVNGPLVISGFNAEGDTFEVVNETKTVTVGNTPGAALPNTGGRGVLTFYILGGFLICAAAALLLRRRRCRA